MEFSTKVADCNTMFSASAKDCFFFLFSFLFLSYSWGNPLIIHGQPPPPPPPVNVPLPPLPHQAPPPPPPEENPLQGMSMSDAEINFDHQFNDWENRFLAWKEENKNHPDKVIAYLHF